MKKNVLIIGSGGREYAFAWKLHKDEKVDKIYCIPGNAGTSKFATNVPLKLNDYNLISEFISNQKIDYTVVGPENPLDGGIVNFFDKKGHKILGPTKECALLESSKIYARDIMKKYNIPHPNYVSCSSKNEVIKARKIIGLPLVLKADGLAAGKGVIICKNENEFQNGVMEFFEKDSFGSASKKISVEECLIGPEISVFAICNGKDYIIMNNAQDHKRIYDNDKGPNTGGMGAYSPTPLYDDKLESKIKSKIIEPTLNAMINEGHPYKGFLYFGLMLVDEEPCVIEYNVRMGDPETQVVLPMMNSSFNDLIVSALDCKLSEFNYTNNNGYCVTVVLAAKGYPGKYEKGHIIEGLNSLENELVFHAGTSIKNNKFVTSGGRILNVVGLGNTLENAIDNAYKIVDKIDFENKYFRLDIAKKGLSYNR